MKKLISLVLLLGLLCGLAVTGFAAEAEDGLFSSAQQAVDSPEWVTALDAAQDEGVTQIFIVGGLGMDLTTASVTMHERDEDGSWKQILSTPGYVGKNGLCADEAHEEGCGQTPIGVYRFNRAFGIAPDPGCAIPYTQVDDDMYWSGDEREGMHYNEMVSIADYPDLDLTNSEHIVDYDYEYQYCLNISFNEDGTPGRGSAIFLHCFGPLKSYTGGCVAIPENKMKLVMQCVKEDCVVVIDTLENMGGGFDAPNAAESISDSEDGTTLSGDASGFVLLSEAVPDAILEIRYYSTYNFVGDRIDGYEEPVALLTREAAEALKEVSDDLLEKGYRLKIYDAYRPQMAVNNFMEWALDTEDVRMKEYFYPELEKDVLFPFGYIAEHSGHSRGSTVDLTLFDMATEKEVDMGGTFDYFGELSHPDYTFISKEQYANRMLLREAMLAHGFRPLEEEWWHFTLEDEPYPDTYFTFPVSRESLENPAQMLSGEEALSLWTDDAQAKDELISYMEAITEEGGADYIPPEDRIAVFDLDGTLFCETDPNYFDYTLLVYRVLEDPDYKDLASDFERETAEKIVTLNETGVAADGLEIDHGKAIASAFAGLTLEEFNDYIQEFKKLPMPSYDGMTRGEGWYKPMLQVVEYLQANGFTVYVVSGTDRFIVRGIVDGSPLRIPPRQIIGSDETVITPDQGDTDGLAYVYDDNDELVLGGEFVIKNLKMNKVAVIAQEIGQQPVLSFGNSTGDSSMAAYVTSGNPYPSLAFMLCCDDTERENGNTEKADAMYDLCGTYGWIPVSMKNDWTTIYGDAVVHH